MKARSVERNELHLDHGMIFFSSWILVEICPGNVCRQQPTNSREWNSDRIFTTTSHFYWSDFHFSSHSSIHSYIHSLIHYPSIHPSTCIMTLFFSVPSPPNGQVRLRKTKRRETKL